MTRFFLSLAAVTCLATPSLAADLYNDPALYQTSGLRGSIGLRYWYSKSRSDLDNSSFQGSGFDLSSTDDVTSHTAELVGTLEDVTAGTFVRGYVGLGRNVSGSANYLGFEMDQKEETTLSYVVVDGGWQLAQFAGNNVRLKGFLGYQYLSDDVSMTYGSGRYEQSRDWHALRMGLTAEGDLASRVGWSVDLAGVPWNYNKVGDWESNWSYGVEADAMLNVDLTQNWQLGVGGRYWWLKSNFDRRYAVTGEKVVFDQNYHRYGLLLESRYQF
ncbi:hypothetical protein [Roseibium sp. Sym1]|uniref:hypothetical protein n=1 Tax=Roseibium sp. Sym1 TaxID=3016006 RepID=UPI0022B44BB4|nr:hypothetical protein [Roseibium sp. Sym1]